MLKFQVCQPFYDRADRKSYYTIMHNVVHVSSRITSPFKVNYTTYQLLILLIELFCGGFASFNY